jgi:glycosyltransferase involved in cell wall biosynthesis
MKGLYLTLMTIDSSPGYAQKIYGEVRAFRKAGIQMDIISLGDEETITLTRHPDLSGDNAVVLRRFRRIYWNNRVNAFSAALRFIETERPEVVYIRHPLSDPLYILFLRTLRRHSRSTIVLTEIPTYPYDLIHKGFDRGRVLLEVDRVCRKFLKRYVDRIVSIDYDDDIFGVKTISIHNGADVDAFTPCNSPESLTSPLRLIGVGNLIDYHGYDRVVSAIERHVGSGNMNHDIEFHIVSPPTPVLADIEKQVERANLNDFVLFHGQKTGSDLDDIFGKCHVAVGALAWHRVNITEASSLKSREYMARGIPFIYAAADKSIPNEYPYALQVPSSEEPIDLENVFKLARESYSNSECRRHMREFAMSNLSWSAVMRPVFEEIDKMKGNPVILPIKQHKQK